MRYLLFQSQYYYITGPHLQQQVKAGDNNTQLTIASKWKDCLPSSSSSWYGKLRDQVRKKSKISGDAIQPTL